MAHYETIDTNPQALRNIASAIRLYTQYQVNIVQEYLQLISMEDSEIAVDAYQEAISEIRNWLARMEEIKQEGDSFAQYLCDRADAIDKMERQQGHTHTLRENTAGFVAGVIMHNTIKGTDQGYEIAGSSIVRSVASGMVSVTATLTGVELAPLDQAQIDNAIDGIVRLADGQAAVKYPEKRIDRSPKPVPQEQIDSHTLVIDPP